MASKSGIERDFCIEASSPIRSLEPARQKAHRTDAIYEGLAGLAGSSASFSSALISRKLVGAVVGFC